MGEVERPQQDAAREYDHLAFQWRWLVKSALTPDEWAEDKVGWTGTLMMMGGYVWLVHPNGTSTQIGIREKVAALCLYGQEFGFTREDVVSLQEALDLIYEVDMERGLPREGVVLSDLHIIIDRLEALLPPEQS